MALQSDSLGPSTVDDTSPLLGVPPAPVPPSITTSPDPVGQQVGWKTLPSADQLLDGVDAGALPIRDVLCGPQLSAAHLALVWA